MLNGVGNENSKKHKSNQPRQNFERAAHLFVHFFVVVVAASNFLVIRTFYRETKFTKSSIYIVIYQKYVNRNTVCGKIRQQRRKFVSLNILSQIKKQTKTAMTKKKTKGKKKQNNNNNKTRERERKAKRKRVCPTLNSGPSTPTRRATSQGTSPTWNILQLSKIYY